MTATTTRRLVDLFRALASDDAKRSKEIALDICELEQNKGHKTYARLLRSALTAAGRGAIPRSGSAPSEGSEATPLSFPALIRVKDSVPISDVELSGSNRGEIDSLIREWKLRSRLERRGVPRRTKLLFHGPPGCGKSLTASALGKELGLPTYLVRFDAVIGAYLGQTALHLRQVFHFAESTPCIVLLDELDALGKRRGNPLDVGELDRIVISLLQELEHSHPGGFVIATTNLASHLDDALWRRFDLSLEFTAPTQSQLQRFVSGRAKALGMKCNANLRNGLKTAKSYAAAENAVLAELRRQILRQ